MHSPSPKVWAQGYHQRKALHIAGASFNPVETALLIQLTAEVMQRHFAQSSLHYTCCLTGKNIADSASFLQTGSNWLRELAIDNMSTWSRISQLTTELILNTMAHRQDDPITFGNCIHILCLLRSTEETGGKIRGLGGAEKIMKLFPRQFPDKRGEAIPQNICTLQNSYLSFTLRTLKRLTESDLNDPYYPRMGTGANLRRVLDTLQAWGGDETSKGLTLQVLYNLMRESDRTGDTARQNTSSYLDVEMDTDLHRNRSRQDPEGVRTITRAQDLLYRLEIETHRIERVTRTLQNQPSHHHITQGMGIRVLQALTPRGFILDKRTPEARDLKWSHPISGTYFDTLPDPVAVLINLTYWHCLKAKWLTLEGTILVPSSGSIIELNQMLLWNHPYVAIKPFLQGMTAYNETRGPRIMIPLSTTIRALGSTAQKPRIHLLLPDWETGHLDLNPRSKRHLLEEHTIDQEKRNTEENRSSTWNHDGGEALGRLGNQILGGHKFAMYLANPILPTRLSVTIIDHCMNLHTPWFTNTQTLPHRLRILGNPCSKSIDLQIPTQQGQTCIEAILLTLQIVGCQQEKIHKESERIQVFKTNLIPTVSESDRDTGMCDCSSLKSIMQTLDVI